MFLGLRIRFYYLRRKIRRYILLKKIIYSKRKGLSFLNYESEISYIKNNGLAIFPYPFEKNYKSCAIKVNQSDGFPYVDFFGKEMFFQRSHSIDHVKYYYNSILMEQDINSPHKYCSDSFTVEKNDTILDLGVAEGNFSLYFAEIANKIYLFESNKGWIEALRKSFLPFSNKTKIINKEVSEYSSETKVALDDIDELKNLSLFIKIDVDGAERSVLAGMKDLLKYSANIKVAICTYHNQEDAEEFESFFQELNFKTEFTPNYMLFYHDKKLKAPFFRKGVLRAWKVD